MPLSRTTVRRLKKLVIDPEYERDIRELVHERHAWRKTRNRIDVASKLCGGMASVVAYAASSVKSTVLTDWLSFSAGTIGTMSLVLMLFASYSGRISKDRTRELNSILRVVGVTPMPNTISATQDNDGDDDMERGMSRPVPTHFDPAMLRNVTVEPAEIHEPTISPRRKPVKKNALELSVDSQ